MRRRTGSRGQAAAEFTIFTFFLFLMLFLILQLTFIGLQKWQFAHFASYSARVWSVHKDESANSSTIKVQGAASLLSDWKLPGQWVFPIIVNSENASRDGVTGVEFLGQGPVMNIYRGWIGESVALCPPEAGCQDVFDQTPLTFFIFESFIPMVKEPTERPGRHDNDCNDTPCTGGNGR